MQPATSTGRSGGDAAVVVLTAVPAEAGAVLEPFPGGWTLQLGPYRGDATGTPAGELWVFAGGIGPAAAAACAGALLARHRPGLLISAGIGGGFAGRAGIGEVVVADRVVHADLGIDTPDGFVPLPAALAGEPAVALAGHLVAAAAARIGAVIGPVLTVSTVTGTERRAADLVAAHQPAAEAMEGAGVLAAATAHRIPFLEVRAISNTVGRRDRDAWNLPAALAALSRAMAALLREPL